MGSPPVRDPCCMRQGSPACLTQVHLQCELVLLPGVTGVWCLDSMSHAFPPWAPFMYTLLCRRLPGLQIQQLRYSTPHLLCSAQVSLQVPT